LSELSRRRAAQQRVARIEKPEALPTTKPGRRQGMGGPKFTTGAADGAKSEMGGLRDGIPGGFCGIYAAGDPGRYSERMVRRPPTNVLRLISDTLCKIETVA
jgi:hypothetical protein